ncbi:crotonase/enoyl-CoA hydratase family protein [Nocardia sp. NPDC004123]
MTSTHTEPGHDSTPAALVEQRGQTLIVTMNRPHVRNAITNEMLAIMVEAWDRLDGDPTIRSCVLTGAGGAFCAGADLKRMTRYDPGKTMSSGDWDPAYLPGLLKGRRLTKPLIAAVEGPAIAGGTEILQATDIRVAGKSAVFGVSEARWSLFPMGGSAVRLPRQIPYTAAAEMLLTGRHITAAEAKDIGLIGQVVPDGEALDRALELAELVNANGPVAVAAILKAIRDTEGMHEEAAFQIEGKIGLKVSFSDDAKEGPRAFTEKRKPSFEGR